MFGGFAPAATASARRHGEPVASRGGGEESKATATPACRRCKPVASRVAAWTAWSRRHRPGVDASLWPAGAAARQDHRGTGPPSRRAGRQQGRR